MRTIVTSAACSRVRTWHLVLASVLLASPALAQGPDCGSAAAISGSGVLAFDLTGRAPAGRAGGGTCVEDTGAFYGDVFWQWTCTSAGDYRFEIDTSHITGLSLYEGLGCSAFLRASTSGYVYSAIVPDRQPGDEILVHLSQHVNSPDAVGTLTVEAISDACSTTVDDSFEDNDRYDTALPIGSGSYANLFAWRGDEDYFRVSIPADHTMRVDWQSHSASIQLRIWDTACVRIAFSFTGTWQWTNTSGTAVDLVLDFGMRQGGECSGYDFDLMIDPAPCIVGSDDAMEPNDSCATPVPITVGSYTGLVTRDTDHDYYSLVVDPGYELRVIGDSNAMLVAMFDPACTMVSEAPRINDYTNISSSPETIVFRIAPDDFYSDGCDVYDLSVTLTPDFCVTQGDDPLEDNDTPQTATSIGSGSYPNLWVSIYDTDFYRTCVERGGTLQADIVFSDNLVALDLELSNAPGVRYEYFQDRVRATYTNQTPGPVEVGMHVFVLPILTDCGPYDLDVTGASNCRVFPSPLPNRRRTPPRY